MRQNPKNYVDTNALGEVPTGSSLEAVAVGVRVADGNDLHCYRW